MSIRSANGGGQGPTPQEIAIEALEAEDKEDMDVALAIMRAALIKIAIRGTLKLGPQGGESS